jgi:predicted nucleotidyltransferase
MGMDATQLAHDLGAAERTVRRAVSEGAVRAHRLAPRTISISDEEISYLSGHWELIRALREGLRTEPNVRLAVLFGSTARGDDHAESDVDILVKLRDSHVFRVADLSAKLGALVGRDVQIVRLEQARQTPPFFLRALKEGRVLVDRDREWRTWRRRMSGLERKARAYRREMSRRAREALAGLGSG